MRRAQLLLAAARAARATMDAPTIAASSVTGRSIAGRAQQLSTRHSHAATWGFSSAAAAAALAVAAVTTGGPAQLDNDALEPEALQKLAEDLNGGSSADKECAVSMLSSLTMYVDHHDALLRTPGILEALINAVTDDRAVPQVRNIALTCTADLMKAPKAHAAALASPTFTAHLLSALRAEGKWAEGLDDGQAAQAQAARCCAELAGNCDTHAGLIDCDLAEQVATQAARLVHEFGSVASEYASASEVPASMDAQSTREEERFIAAAVFGLAGSRPGAELLCRHPQTLQGVAHWAGSSKDPILQRWGVGALAHLVAAAPEAASQVAKADGLPALLTGLNCSDPQAQCFASAAIGSLASGGDKSLSASLAKQGLGPALACMLQADSPAQVGLSEGVRQGVRRCALRCVNAVAANPQLASALRQAGVVETLQALSTQGGFKTEELQRLAQAAVQKLGGPTQSA